MKIICAMCKKTLGEKDGEGISTGWCRKCLKKARPDTADEMIKAVEKATGKPLV